MNKIESFRKPMLWSILFVFSSILAGCGGSSSGGGSSGADFGATGAICSGTGCVDLGAAGNYVILGESGVTYTPVATVSSSSMITGNIGISPIKSIGYSGLALNLPAGSAYSTSTLVAGKVYAPDYAPPTPSNLITATGDKLTAYTAAASMATAGGGLAGGSPGTACPGTGNLSGLTLTPGVYTCTVAILIDTGATVTLSGAGVYVIKTTQTLSQAASSHVVLSNGALPENVFWQVAGAVSIGSSAHMEGVILSASSISLVSSATEKGRLMSATLIAMDNNTVTQP